ncbi:MULTISPECIES: prephenate dehydrogenase/arogenate dehydrogenase family protein [Salinibaculum]|uniref:prephenate dehydrogenase/arogenate dehydrogenase family protein n=1 Tax=Salinibaculum TaxID=2732368 RepID=UPI0030D41E8A
MDILVVGAGAMGRWMGQSLVDDGPESVELAFVDTDADAALDAADAVAGRAVATDTDETFDGVCVAVPIPAATATIAEYADRAERAMFDVTGTMTDPVEAMREHAPGCERLSLHPLFAPENEPGNLPVVVDESGPVTDAVRDALHDRGNELFETTAAEHDEAMETVQARTHTAVLAYVLAAEEVDDRFHTPISADLQSLSEQVTDGEARVYGDIQAAFDGADDVAAAARRIADADMEAFERLYADAGE